MTYETWTATPSTRVRVVVHEATAMPTPEVRGLAWLDLVVNDRGVLTYSVRSERFTTAADEITSSLRACTPADIASAVWTPGRPDVVAGWGAGLWDVLPRAITGALPRIDVLKVARATWHEASTWEPVALAASVGVPAMVELLDPRGSAPLARRAQAVANLLSAVLLCGVDHLPGAKDAATRSALAGVLQGLSGDWALEKLLHISAQPIRPLRIPGPWDEETPWTVYATPSEDLCWIRDAPETSEVTRALVTSELGRRAALAADLLVPRMLLRRSKPE